MANDTSTLGKLPSPGISEGVRVTVLTLGWLACVNGVFGNVLIITTLLSQQALRSVHNIYIANLALVDLLAMTYSLPFWLLDIQYTDRVLVVNSAHCCVNAFMMALCFVVSVYTLLSISFNRYLKVCHHSLYKRLFNKTRTIASCIVIWAVSVLQASIPIFDQGAQAVRYEITFALCGYGVSTDAGKAFFVMFLLTLILPTVLIFAFNCLLLGFWRRSKTRIEMWTRSEDRQQPSPPCKLSSSDIALIRSLILVSVLLVVLYLPMAVSIILSWLTASVSPSLHTFLVLSVACNHSINWIVYGLMNKNFRNGYRKLLTCNRRGVKERLSIFTIRRS